MKRSCAALAALGWVVTGCQQRNGASVDHSTTVAPANSPASGELVAVRRDFSTNSLTDFSIRSGIDRPVAEALLRYQDVIGVSGSDLVATKAGASRFNSAGQVVTYYQQVSHGYAVAGYGYDIGSQNGFFRSATGKVMPGLPDPGPPRVSAAEALQITLKEIQLARAPWQTDAVHNRPPVGKLLMIPVRGSPRPTDFVLVWRFLINSENGFAGSRDVEVDARSGGVIGSGPRDLE